MVRPGTPNYGRDHKGGRTAVLRRARGQIEVMKQIGRLTRHRLQFMRVEPFRREPREFDTDRAIVEDLDVPRLMTEPTICVTSKQNALRPDYPPVVHERHDAALVAALDVMDND